MDLLQRQPKQDIGTMTVFAEVGLVASAASLRAGWGQLGCLHEAEGRRRGPSADTAASQQGSQWPWSLARSRPGALLAVPGSHSPARCVSAPGFHQLGALQRPGPGHPPVPPRERGLAAAQAGGQKPRHAVWKTREGGQGQPGPVRVCAWGWAAGMVRAAPCWGFARNAEWWEWWPLPPQPRLAARERFGPGPGLRCTQRALCPTGAAASARSVVLPVQSSTAPQNEMVCFM